MSTATQAPGAAIRGSAGAQQGTQAPREPALALVEEALESIAGARGRFEAKARGAQRHNIIRREARADKSGLLQAARRSVQKLRAGLDLCNGGPLAANLDDLYDYLGRQLLLANLQNRLDALDEVSHLLAEVRRAWPALPAEVTGRRAT